MKISLIFATCHNNVLATSDGRLPWHLPDDLKRFKKLTMGKPVIMGRKTFEAMNKKPLAGRKNIVMTNQVNYKTPKDVIVVNSVESALKAASGCDEVMIIGGAQIFELFLPLADCIYLTKVHTYSRGTVFMPWFNKGEWNEIYEEYHPPDEKHKYAFSFIKYYKKKN